MSGNSAQERVSVAALSLNKAEIAKRRAEASAEYGRTTEGVRFSKDFWTHQEAIMRDPMETVGARFMAWLKRYSWGEFALFAMAEDGKPYTQVDAARMLGITFQDGKHKGELNKTAISQVVSYYEARGYLYRDGKAMYPSIAPVLGPDPKKVTRAGNFSEFLENWKVTRSSIFEEMEVARARVNELRKVQRADYKKWQAQAKNAPASLLETRRHYVDQTTTTAPPEESAQPEPPVVVVPPPEHAEIPPQTIEPAEPPAAVAPLPEDVEILTQAIEPHGNIPKETVEGLLAPHPPGSGLLMARNVAAFRFTGNERSRVAVLIDALRRWNPPVEAVKQNGGPDDSDRMEHIRDELIAQELARWDSYDERDKALSLVAFPELEERLRRVGS